MDNILEFISFGILGTDKNLTLKKISQFTSPVEMWRDLNLLFDEIKEEKQALVFIHGFNNSFEDSAIRAGQLGFDLSSKVTAFFSWPSQGKTLKYSVDEATISASEKFLKEFLVDFVEKSGAIKVNLIAHSMGNRGLLRVIENIQKERPEIKFGNIILAAPDVDTDVFKNIADAYIKSSDKTTLYVSPHDKAVTLSSIIHGYDRAGLTPPVTIVDKINTIEVNLGFGLVDLGHGYFAESGLLLDDMFDILANNLSPEKRVRLEEIFTEEEEKYWLLSN